MSAHHRVLLILMASLCSWLLPLAAGASDWFPRATASQAMTGRQLAPRLRLDRDLQPTDAATAGLSGGRGRYAWPALASAVLPGAGEIATGHIWNGIPLLAAEVALWVGYNHYNQQGHDLRDDYEAFVNRYWDYDRWQSNLAAHYDAATGGVPPWYNPEEFPGGCDCSPPYIPKNEDPQEYYENAGKYRHFWPGWEDWQYSSSDPANSDSQALRAEYISLRNRSNDAFDSRGTMLGLAVVTRLVSVAQTLWLVRRDTQQAEFRLTPMYSERKGTGLKVSFHY